MIDSPLALLGLLAAVVAVPLVLRRVRAVAPGGVRVLARTALAKGVVVAVLAVDDRRLLVGAGERGVQLLAELDGSVTDGASAVSTTTDTMDPTVHLDDLAGRDAVELVRSWTGHDGTSSPRVGGRRTPPTTSGPGIGLVDRLRAMTVRTPEQGRPTRVPLLRR